MRIAMNKNTAPLAGFVSALLAAAAFAVSSPAAARHNPNALWEIVHDYCVPAAEGAKPLLKTFFALLLTPSVIPAVSVVSSMKLRPFKGSASIRDCAITPPIIGLSVSIAGVVA